MVTSAPVFATVADEVLQRLSGRIFVAHNARFDYGFLRVEFKRLGMRFHAPVLCTVKLSRRLYPHEPHHNLDAIMERHGLSCEARHRALPDARVLAGFLAALDRDVDAALLDERIATLIQAPSLPPALDPELIDDLPDAPGVYRLYSQDALLYVGSGSNIRSDVLGHFTNPGSQRDRMLMHEVRRIDWVETAGEIGAALAQLRARRACASKQSVPAQHRLFSIELKDRGGWLQPKIVEFDAAAECFGSFRHERDANKALDQIVKAHKLCRKMLDLEGADGSCVGYQFGHCRGACVAKEPSVLHNTRLQLALAGLKLKAWPFDGPIAVRERSWAGLTEIHVFDEWRHLGSTAQQDQVEDCARRDLPAFDHDVFRILNRALKRDRLQIVPLGGRARVL
jgi:DNA polymerase-3 subunit epsilon